MSRTYTGTATFYARKLERVMERFGVDVQGWSWNSDRFGAWVEFRRRGAFYRLEQTVARARGKGIPLSGGTDCLAQIALTLEDLARMAERGIYDLDVWVEGLKALPAGGTLTPCFRVLQFDRLPASAAEINARFRDLLRSAHPDTGGPVRTTEAADRINALQRARDEALALLGAGGGVAAAASRR